MSSNILDASDPSRFSTGTLTQGDHKLLGAKLGRLQHVSENLDKLMLVRSFVQRLQIAASEITGAIFVDSQIAETELQGATFKHCHFKKVKFENASFREVRFENCSFEDCRLMPSMDPSDIDGVTFQNCYIHDAEEGLLGLVKSNAWKFEGCVIASPTTLESDDNIFIPLLAFTPAAVATPAPAPVAPAAPAAKEAGKPTAPAAAPRSGANRFDQLELG